MPTLILERGPDGLWIGLALVLVPLIALAAGAPEPAAGAREPAFPVVILLLTVGVLFWANMILAGDVAAWLGAPRWHGIAITAASGCLLTTWRNAWRIVMIIYHHGDASPITLSLIGRADPREASFTCGGPATLEW